MDMSRYSGLFCFLPHQDTDRDRPSTTTRPAGRVLGTNAQGVISNFMDEGNARRLVGELGYPTEDGVDEGSSASASEICRHMNTQYSVRAIRRINLAAPLLESRDAGDQAFVVVLRWLC